MRKSPTDNTPPPQQPKTPAPVPQGPMRKKSPSGFASNLLSTLLGTGLGITAAWCIYSFQKSDSDKLAKDQNTAALDRVAILLEGQFANEIRAQHILVQLSLIQECKSDLADGVARLRSVTSPIIFGEPSKEQLRKARRESHQYTGTATSMSAAVYRLGLLIPDYKEKFDRAADPLLCVFTTHKIAQKDETPEGCQDSHEKDTKIFVDGKKVFERNTGAVRQLADFIELADRKDHEIAKSMKIRTDAGNQLLVRLDEAMAKVRNELDLISKDILKGNLSSENKTKQTADETAIPTDG